VDPFKGTNDQLWPLTLVEIGQSRSPTNTIALSSVEIYEVHTHENEQQNEKYIKKEHLHNESQDNFYKADISVHQISP